MNSKKILIFAISALTIFSAHSEPIKDQDGFVSLPEDGTLKGWTNHYTCGESKIANGVLVTDVKDDKNTSGMTSIQHHGEKGKTYKFRNLKIKELEGNGSQ